MKRQEFNCKKTDGTGALHSALTDGLRREDGAGITGLRSVTGGNGTADSTGVADSAGNRDCRGTAGGGRDADYDGAGDRSQQYGETARPLSQCL